MATASEPTKDERALRVISIIGGSMAAVSLTLVIAYPFAQALMFTIPVVMATTARLAGRRTLERAALVLGVVMFASYAAGMSLALASWGAMVLVVVLVVGPLIVIYLVGELLASLDRLARLVWVTASSIALVGGFLGLQLSANAAVTVALPATVFGLTFTLLRLRRVAAAAPQKPR